MFTDGLDPSAIRWVQEGVNLKSRVTSPILADAQSARFIKESAFESRKKSKTGWADLPPAHFHSGLINPQLSSVVLDQSTESTGSATENNGYQDTSDSEEHESGCYSLDSESPINRQDNIGSSDPVKAGRTCHRNTDDYYYEYDRRLLSSKSDSRSESRRESFGHVEGRQTVSQVWQKVNEGGYHQCDQKYRDETEASWDRSSGVIVDPASKISCTVHVEKTTLSAYASEFYQCDTNQCPLPGGSYRYNTMVASPSAPPIINPSSRTLENCARSEILSTQNNPGEKSNGHIEVESSRAAKIQKMHDQRNETVHDVDSTHKIGQGSESTINQASSSKSQHSIHCSAQAVWPTVIAYDACVRLCLQAWSRGCIEAPDFLLNECSLLRSSFGLKNILLQPQQDLSQNIASMADLEATAASKQNKTAGKLRVQVRKVRLTMKVPQRCTFPSLDATCPDLDIKADLLAAWGSIKMLCLLPQKFHRSASERGTGNGYMQAGAHYMRQVSGILKASVNSLRNASLADALEEAYMCHLKLKSAPEEVITQHPGSGESHIFHPESAADDLIVEVYDSKCSLQGRTHVQLTSLSDDQNDRLRWWSLYRDHDDECVGKVQLFISFMAELSAPVNKLGVVTETLAYDIVLQTAMKMQHFGPRSLRLHGPWKWLLAEFSAYYGVSDAYKNLRYLYYVMEIATPTEDCLLLIYDLLYPIIGCQQPTILTRQEKRIMHDIHDQVEQLLALVFENYKSLDEASSSGISQSLTPIADPVAPALAPAVKLYTLLHDVLSSEAQTMLQGHFQTGAMRRCKRYMVETDEFVNSNNEGFLIDPLSISGAYCKMVTLCNNLSNEIEADIKIHSQHVLPSCIDLPSIATGIYSLELSKRLKSFLVACPPTGPSAPTIDLLIATAEFERKLLSWNIRAVKGGVDAKALFHLYIVLWIQDKRLNLLDMCKPEKLRWTGVTTEHGTSPFVEEMYERIRETLNEYHALLDHWPEYTIPLESAIADVETAILTALEKQFIEVLTPLKDVMVHKKFSIQYVQKLTRRRPLAVYSVPNQLGIFLNTIKRLLDSLRPKIENQMKAWVACLPAQTGLNFGERLNEVTVLLRAKYKNFLQAIVEKLFDNTCLQKTTKLKKILQATREAGGEAEIREQMQLLSSQLTDTINHLHDVFSTRVFVAICRGYWDRMGQDVLHFLETKENRSWYKGPWYALSILDDVFASQMQKLQGHALQEKDLEPPRSVMDARSMLSKDGNLDLNETNYFYF